MKRQAAAAVALMSVAGIAYAMRRPQANAAPQAGEGGGPVFQLPEFELPSLDALIETNQTAADMNNANADRNESAFRETVIVSEGTNRGGRNPYATVYSYAFTIADFSDHPGNRGWKGVRLPDNMCKNAGFGPGCVSTAAGAYQITKTTWNRLKGKIHLPDFSKTSQDRACMELIKERGALADVRAGRFAQAIAKCRREWASLPGAGYGQGENSLASLQAAYVSAGGRTA